MANPDLQSRTRSSSAVDAGIRHLSGSAAYRARRSREDCARWSPSWLVGARWPAWLVTARPPAKGKA